MDTTIMLTTISVALITAVFGPIAVAWAKKQLEKNSLSTPLNEAIELNDVVDDQLEIIIAEIGSDRVWVTQFHNGGHFYPKGKSIQKFSMFYEKTSPNTAPSQMTFQNIPCSLFPKSMSELVKKGELAVPNTKVEHFGLGPFAEQYGSKSFYMIALKDLHDNFIGTLAISYNKVYKLTKDDWIYMRQKAGVIGTLLDEYLDTQK
jgi:hypothetical protein